MSLDRSLGLGVGLFVTAMLTALSVAQSGLGFLQSGGRTSRLPPHRDPRSITKYSDQVLDDLRTKGDTRAAALIDSIATSGSTAVEDFYDELLKQRYFSISDYETKSYKNGLSEFEDHIAGRFRDIGSPSRLARAGRFFKRHLFKISVILSTSSLLEAYACAKGVQVLRRTKYLSNDTNRRLNETLQFVMYVSEPNAFDASKDGKGLAAIIKVRLMHACIRWIILKRAQAVADWDLAWGVPINGEDLLGMLMGFSGVVIRDLPELDVMLTTEEVDDYLYLWNVVGELLGVRKDLLPADLGEALALIAAVKSRQQESSVAGREMTAALLRYHAELLDDFADVGVGAMRRLAGDYVCDILGVPDSEYADRSGLRGYVFRILLWWGNKLITRERITVVDLDGVAKAYEPFDIPKSLWSVVFPKDDA